jgi:hypothetical protein
MPTFSERANIASNPIFLVRVRQAAVKYALYVSADVGADPADVRLLKQVLANPGSFALVFAIAAAQNDFAGNGVAGQDCTIDDAQGDAALSSVIEGQVWPAFAREVPPA